MSHVTAGAWHRLRATPRRCLAPISAGAWHRLKASAAGAWHRLRASAAGAWHRLKASAAGAWHRLKASAAGAWHRFLHQFPVTSRRCLAPLVFTTLALIHGTSPAAEPPETPPPNLRSTTQQLPWAQVLDVVLPGLVLDIAPWPMDADSTSTDGLAVLVKPEDDADGPRHLYRLRGVEGDLVPVAVDLPEKADTLLRHGEQLWIGEEGRVHRFRERVGLTTLLELEGLRLDGLVERGLISDQRVLIPEVGRVRQYTADLQPTDEGFEQPVEARRRSRRIELWSPPLRRLGDDPSRFVTDPISLDAHRLRVTLIDLEAEEEARQQDSWLRFAGPEDVEQFHFVHFDGRPAVIVATTRGDKLGIFEKLELRTFLLKPDRTRAGRLPRNSLETVTRNWYRLEPHVLDFDADGKDDLLLIQPEGMGAGDLLVELHVGRGGGLLEPRSRRSKLKAEGAAWDMSSDFNGDGTVDLLVVSEGELRLYAGLAQHKKRVIDDEPLHRLGSIELTPSNVEVAIHVSSDGSQSETVGLERRPRLLQLDDDPRPEIVLVESLRGRAVMRIIDITTP